MTRRSIEFALAAALLVLLLVGMYVLFVRTYAGQVIDERAFLGAARVGAGIDAPSARVFLDGIPVVGTIVGIGITVAVGLVRRIPRVLGVALGSVAASVLTTEVLKHVVLTRPTTGATDGWANSFPSGHTTVAASLAFAVFLVSAPRWRLLAASVGWLFSVATGVLLVALGWHRPSDVVAGYVVVAVWGCLAGAVLTPATARSGTSTPSRATRTGSRMSWWFVLVCAVLSAASFAVVWTSVDERHAHMGAAFVGGVCAIVATCSAFATLAYRMFHRVR
jgi:membrane-associated phospholipid phosphatase